MSDGDTNEVRDPSGMTWHVAEDDLRAYGRGELAAPMLWSADTHLMACARCRGSSPR